MEHSTLSSVEIFNVDKQRLLVKLIKINASGRKKIFKSLFLSNFHYVKFSVKTMKKNFIFKLGSFSDSAETM